MVFFTCNACGQAIKKAMVEKHYQQKCRNCEVLSCMDCGKDFFGDEYKQHTQCISEDQKYGGKGYQAPQSANKGEAKQEQWLQRVREAVAAGNISGNIKNLLDQIADYPNVPRKKAKFENFVRNSLKVHNPKIIEQVWNVFSAANTKPDPPKPTPTVPKETREAKRADSSSSESDSESDSNSDSDGGSQGKEEKKAVKETIDEKKDGEVSFEVKQKPLKNTTRDQMEPLANTSTSEVNNAGKSTEKTTKKKKKKKKEKTKLLAGNKYADHKQINLNHNEEDTDVDGLIEKKKKKNLKRKGDKESEAAVVKKKKKKKVGSNVNDEKERTKTCEEKKKRKKKSDKLKSLGSNIDASPFANGNPVHRDNKTSKKRKSLSVNEKDIIKDSHESSEKHTTPLKQKKKKSQNKTKSSEINTSTTTDESFKVVKTKQKKKVNKNRTGAEPQKLANSKKSKSSKNRKPTADGPSSDTTRESSSSSDAKKKKKTKVSCDITNITSSHSTDSEHIEIVSTNGKTKTKRKLLSPARVGKVTKKKSKESSGVIFSSHTGNITSFELIGDQIVIHVKNQTFDQTNARIRRESGMSNLSLDPSPESETAQKTSEEPALKTVVEQQEGGQESPSRLDRGQKADVKEKKKKKRKLDQTNGGHSDLSGLTLEPSSKKTKKIATKHSEDKEEEAMVEPSPKKAKKKKKEQEQEPNSIEEDQETMAVKKKKKKKRKLEQTNSDPSDHGGPPSTEPSPKKVKKTSTKPSTAETEVESLPVKPKKKKKKKKESGGDDGDGKASKKTKSKQQQGISIDGAVISNGLTAPSKTRNTPGGDLPTKKKKKKSKESTLTSDASEADALSIQETKKKKKKSKKEKGSPVKSNLQEDIVVKSIDLENGHEKVKVKKAKKKAKDSKENDPNNNAVSFSTTLPIQNSKSGKSLEKKKKSHKKNKTRESSDMSNTAEMNGELKKVKKKKKVKVA